MASAKAKIRHVFGDTFSCRAAPPDILVKLSGIVPEPPFPSQGIEGSGNEIGLK